MLLSRKIGKRVATGDTRSWRSLRTSMYLYLLIPNGFRWTADELKKVIDMLRRPEFDAGQIDPDLHKRMNKAIEDGRIKCFNMRESNLDGDQDLNFWTREMEDVVRKSGTSKLEIPESELPALQQKAVDLLDLLQNNLPYKTGEKAKWNFKKAHSILHKVREIVLWGNSDNTSCQSPEVGTSTYQYIPV